jgi:hypothetical protein
MDVLPFNQFGEYIRGALEAEAGIVQAHYGEDLSADFET